MMKKVKSVVSVAATAPESAKPYVLLCTRVIRLGVRSCAPMGQSHYWPLKITGVFGWWKPCHRVRSGKRTKRDTAVVIQRQQMSTVGPTRPGCYRFPSLGCHLHHKWWHSLRFAVALVLVLAILTVREWVDVWEGGRCPLSGSGKRRQRKNIDICFFVVRFIATAMLVAAMIADVCIIVVHHATGRWVALLLLLPARPVLSYSGKADARVPVPFSAWNWSRVIAAWLFLQGRTEEELFVSTISSSPLCGPLLISNHCLLWSTLNILWRTIWQTKLQRSIFTTIRKGKVYGKQASSNSVNRAKVLILCMVLTRVNCRVYFALSWRNTMPWMTGAR